MRGRAPARSAGGGRAFATLVTNADYGTGALALARSLRRTGTDAPLLVLATGGGGRLDELEAEGAQILPVSRPTLSETFRARHARDALHRTAPFDRGGKPAFHDPLDNFCKLELWKLEAFERIVFLDADTVVVKPIDVLFEYPAFAGAPNLYRDLSDFHRLNSGVFVAEPSRQTYDRMVEALDRPGAFWRRTDQTFLEATFPDWHRLPYVFNVLQYVYFNLPDLWVWRSVRVAHYQYEKPWAADHPKRHLLQPLIGLWRRLYEGGAPPEDLPPPAGRDEA